MSLPSIAVCVACFFGYRTRNWEDGSVKNPALSHVLRQVKYLDEHTVGATRISFVVSSDLDGLPEDAQERYRQKKAYDEFCLIVEAKNASDPNRFWEVLQRPNLNISYGAWKWYLDGVCSDVDYVYLLEDDYSPAFKGYDVEVVNRVFATPEARSTIVKACSIYVDDTLHPSDRRKGSKSLRAGLPHAAVSNGVVNMQVYREVPEGLMLCGTFGGRAPRRSFAQLQKTYLCNYTEHPSGKYSVFNLGQYYSVPFMETKNSQVLTFGNPGSPVLFSPTELLEL